MIIVEKPWGYEKWIAHCKEYVMKEIFIKKGYKTSLQYHNYKKETNYIFSGKVKISVDNYTTEASAGTIIDLNPGQLHQIEAIEDTLLFESSTYHLSDVCRVEDSYGREVNNKKSVTEGYGKNENM